MRRIEIQGQVLEEVMTFEMRRARVSMLKCGDSTWIVSLKRSSNPPQVKVINCISFEHACFAFDGCVDRLKEWKN